MSAAAFKVQSALKRCPSSSPDHTTMCRLVVFTIFTWKQLLLSKLTRLSGACIMESDPCFRLMPSRYIAPSAGAPREMVVMEAIDSGRIVSWCRTTAFHRMHFSFKGFLCTGMVFVGMVMAGIQLAVKVS